ncbi:fibrinogen-like YCDxxxxGGGW domain-containing protein [uncultured Microbacterium sp.]|uniref:fibrinogen-like YCDxxxxGGGW domain-containing protein n=1 Tax=uncultured Microbacterium sp. TaxID=191216 RepID=UPI002628B8FE|nr:fibrinogen-like YCDxxxxGGGW domain-containing protein [uncultured Microbacterium sp.]
MNRTTPRTPTRIILALATAMITAAAMLTPMAASAAEPALPAADGLSEITAAASCWEIKQNRPAAPDGVYWLLTPAMTQAEQFYCDQTRNGGGWLLVGRGRDGWATATAGSGTPAQVRETVTGTAAFTPRQLSGEIIDQLNNDQPIGSLTDGIRLVRATNQAGTTWQEGSFTLSSPRDGWTWFFNNQQRIAQYTLGGSTRTGGQTSNFGWDNNYNRVRTITGSTEGWSMGFGFGSNIRGNPSDTSYLWSKNTSTGYARPFTQVFIRPKLKSADLFTAIGATGTPAVENDAVVSSFAETQNWGVAGLGAGPSSIEGSNEVSAFAEVDGTVFVGGNFTTVQKTAGGGSAQSQSYLAAFSRDSAEFVSSFRPTFNNQVKALAALPGDRVAVGGYFTQVNGEPYAGLVVLNASTGAIDPAFTGRLINALSGGVPVVRTLDVQDGWLYAAGSFTHSTGGSATNQRYTRGAARFSVTDGTPDGSWNPEFNGTVVSLDASDRGDRVYFAGFFSQSQSRPADKGAAMSTADTSLIAWPVVFSNRDGGRTGYQQAVLEVGDRVWLGGAEHSLMSYDRDGLAMLSSSIGETGGDFQAIASDGQAVYGGCHCFDTQYEGATRWPSIGTGWTSADAIYGTGAWSAASGDRMAGFNGSFNTNRGAGAWALFVDSAGTLWQGGDYTYSTRAGYARQWSGGFVRHAQMDASAPTAPSELTATTSSEGVSLSWAASSDDRAVSVYQVLRHDRVVATVTTTSTTLPAAPATTDYFVRALDARGNASASTAAVRASAAPEQPASSALISAGSSWAYVYDAVGPTEDWTSTGYDDSSWGTGAAPLGWGQTQLGTTLSTSVSPKPLASFYRHDFQISDASVVESVTLTTRADDGVVVYVNGSEVARKNVDAGTAGVSTYANAAVSASAALANPVTVTIPGHHFTTGTNVVAVSVHSNYRSTPSHSFELTAEATIGTQPAAPEPAPEPEPEPEPQPGPEPASGTILVASDTDWSYLYSGEAIAAGWETGGFDASAWPTGDGVFGWGHTVIDTPLDTSLSPRPVTSYYRTLVDVAALDFETVTLTTRADDGIVVYVNGTEVARKNIDAGPVTPGTYANAAVSASVAASTPLVVEVPASAFIVGNNTIAVEVHSNYRSTPSHSFALMAVSQ